MWHDAGHEVVFYNEGDSARSEFNHSHIANFKKSRDRDILIAFRSPIPDLMDGAKGKKIWYSNDQYTTGSFADFRSHVDEVVVISEFHNNYFKTMYNIWDAHVIDIPVRTWEYPETKKVRNSCIFTSVPDRGLLQLAPIWDRIVEQVPDATLTITGDWSLWDNNNHDHHVRPYRLAFANKKNVTYRSAISRKELVDIQSSAEFHLYPGIYPELFCISVAESQVAGALPITSTVGAVDTTNRFGYKIQGNPSSKEFQDRFVDKTVECMKSDSIRAIGGTLAKVEFGSESILAKWDELLYG